MYNNKIEKMKRLLLLVMLYLFTADPIAAQGEVGVKTNLLYGATSFTPNLGMEIGLGKRTTVDISGGYNWFNLKGSVADNQKRVHWIIQPEFRYFLCEKFNGHFFGIHGLYSQYNISEHKLPLLFGKDSKDFRFQGSAYGAGISYGYQLMLSKSWNVEFNLGFGYARMLYDKYECQTCGSKLESKTKNYFGPTKAGISLIYIIK